MKQILTFIFLGLLISCQTENRDDGNMDSIKNYSGPVLDMYIHADSPNDLPPKKVAMCLPLSTIVPYHDPKKPFSDSWFEALSNPQCDSPIWSPESYTDYLSRVQKQLDGNKVVAGASGTIETLQIWDSIFADQIIPSLKFRIGRENYTVDSLRKIIIENDIKILGEVSNQYEGIAPNDKRMYPYYQLAEELDIVVCLHMGSGAPGTAYLFSPDYLAKYSNPLLLEDVLKSFPKLRLCVNHYGEPFIDEMITMLYHYPQLYVNLGGIQWCYPREYFHEYHLKKLVQAGFGKRILFGSDTFIWPEILEESISIIDDADFLSYQQKADIFYNNAMRFLRM